MKTFLITAAVLASSTLFSCKEKRIEAPKPLSAIGEPQAIIPVSDDTILSSGRKNIFLIGRRDSPGLFVERSIFQPGYRSNPHTHPGNLNITVIRGIMNIAFSNDPDSASIVNVYGPGSFVIIPANQTHFEWFTETSVIDINGIGPINTVNAPIIHSMK